jgi:hypothetical protein
MATDTQTIEQVDPALPKVGHRRPTWLAVVFIVSLLAVATTAYLVFTDQPQPAPAIDEDLELRRLVNQGLIPKQALETTFPDETISPPPATAAKTEAEILQSLANRGLIPQQAVPRILSDAERAILVDAVNRGLVPKEVLEEG